MSEYTIRLGSHDVFCTSIWCVQLAFFMHQTVHAKYATKVSHWCLWEYASKGHIVCFTKRHVDALLDTLKKMCVHVRYLCGEICVKQKSKVVPNISAVYYVAYFSLRKKYTLWPQPYTPYISARRAGIPPSELDVLRYSYSLLTLSLSLHPRGDKI